MPSENDARVKTLSRMVAIDLNLASKSEIRQGHTM